MTNEKNILNKFYLVVALFFVFVIVVGFKLFNIQFVHGDEYEKLTQERVFKNFTIPANRGNLYDATGNLLATSIPEYDIHFDAVTVDQEDFDQNLMALSEELSKLLGKPATYYKNALEEARHSGHRYFPIAKGLRYSEYMKLKSFPLFNKGPFKGGLVTEQRTERELPLGRLAERTVGKGKAGLEGAYNEYLKGKDGHRLKQKIANGIWKPVSDGNQVEPQDGLDVISTIDVNIQDIVNHTLLKTLENYKADHGTAVVMEIATGEIKGMANLGRTDEGKYYEKRNYAIWEAQEPGSTFKLMAMVAALEDRVTDTSKIYDSEGGVVKYFNRAVRDSDVGGYGKISAGRAFELSSNTIFSKIITEGYEDNPESFSNRLDYMGLNQKIDLEIAGEGTPKIPHPDDEDWYGTTLPWMSFGYGVSMTPLQVLNFYNAIANDGIEVKPRLIKEIRDRDRLIERYDQNPEKNSIVSKETARIAQDLMKRAIKKGTGAGIYSEKLPLAGKTGTAVTGYSNAGDSQYTASFAGYFPADNPQYSAIVVVNQPDKSKGFYASVVAAPTFEEIAHNIYRRTAQSDTLNIIKTENPEIEESFKNYFSLAQNHDELMPDVVGLPAMDALSLIENMGFKAQLNGNGEIKEQSIEAGQPIENNKEPIKLTTR